MQMQSDREDAPGVEVIASVSPSTVEKWSH